MADHLTPQQVHGYQQRLLAPEERLRVNEHLYACDDCRQRVRSGMTLTTLAASLAPDTDECEVDEHLTTPEIVAYVMDTIDVEDRLFIQAHIESCTDCAFRIQRLQQFRPLL